MEKILEDGFPSSNESGYDKAFQNPEQREYQLYERDLCQFIRLSTSVL